MQNTGRRSSSSLSSSKALTSRHSGRPTSRTSTTASFGVASQILAWGRARSRKCRGILPNVWACPTAKSTLPMGCGRLGRLSWATQMPPTSRSWLLGIGNHSPSPGATFELPDGPWSSVQPSFLAGSHPKNAPKTHSPTAPQPETTGTAPQPPQQQPLQQHTVPSFSNCTFTNCTFTLGCN